jgi:uncharacterized protein (TIGR03118 family)
MHFQKRVVCTFISASAALCLSGCGGNGSAPAQITTVNSDSASTSGGKFTQTNLVADLASAHAATTDPNLTNPWGLAFSPSGPFWVANNTSGTATVYGSDGSNFGLVVSIPTATGGTKGPVSGQVYNGTNHFGFGGSVPSFIFCSEDGIITAWTGGTAAVKVADRSKLGAVYKGLAIGQYLGSDYLYATNFHAGVVDIFTGGYKYVTSFTDKTVPAGYAPFGIRSIGDRLYVTFAKQLAPANHDNQPGAGFGYVDEFNTRGTLLARIVSNGALNSPWGVEIAPAGFGKVAGDLLVGNFGDGKINAYNPTTHAFVGVLSNAQGTPLVIPGLWAIAVGNGGSAGSASNVYFTAGPDSENHGIFGALSNAP